MPQLQYSRFTLPLILASLTMSQAYADQADLSPWQVRAGVSLIAPKSNNGAIIDHTADVTIDNRAGPTVNIAYFIAPNWAIDLFGGLAFKHQINVNGNRAGETKHLPPILSLQYHFRPEATLRPYVGVGLNYTAFTDEKLDNGARLKLRDSWGPALQVGLDYAFDQHWTIGADVRYARINTKTSINGTAVGDVDINPTVYTLNVGYRF